jgi:hypothetical protein
MADDYGPVGPLIFPIGHYHGAHYPSAGASAGADADFHVVRIGWDTYKLDGNGQLAVWALAHGLPEAGGDDTAPWTRSAVEGAARAAGVPNVTRTVAELIAKDLLVEVTPGTDEAIEFARMCRTRSLLIGLGNTAAEPQRYGIGVAENAPAIRVSGFTYELWKWGHACDNLWHVCQVLAAAGDPTDPDQADPERVLTRCLASIQVLLASGAIYLDEAREDALEDQVAGLQDQPVG